MTDSAAPRTTHRLADLQEALARYPRRLIACSGGVDSLLLATVAHRAAPASTVVAHAVTPAVPGAATGRVMTVARREGRPLKLVTPGELDDERYLANPTDRCYFCKSHLYTALDLVADQAGDDRRSALLSGANTDDLGEYRPGLRAASEHHVQHPFVEAGFTKQDIRAVARALDLDFAEPAASPCLASRLSTGTRVTAARLRAVDAGEEILRQAGMPVVRCRLRANRATVALPEADRARATRELLSQVLEAMAAVDPSIEDLGLDERPYRPGQAILFGS